MRLYHTFAGLLIAALVTACATTTPVGNDGQSGSKVELVNNSDGTFALIRNGEPYFVKGAGAGTGVGLGGNNLELLAASGGNAIRTWGIEQLEHEVDGKPLIDRAHELGISVLVGFWVGHPRHGFDYGDARSLEIQRVKLRDAVRKYRDHPAVLAWGLGNEMEAFMPGEIDIRIWQELNHLAATIKRMDPHHPVVTVVAEVDEAKIAGIKAHYPNLDILGVNAYGSAPTVGKRLLKAGWDGPYLLTEFGVSGTWETNSTSWGAPIEPDPSTKALETYTVYNIDRDDNAGRTLGSYVFFWGHKQEATATWFGMFLASGEKLPRVDAMAYAWTGAWPDNRTPKLTSLETSAAFQQVQPGATFTAAVDCSDREGDALKYVWDIRAETSVRRVGGDAEPKPPSFPEAIDSGQGTPRIEFTAPTRSGGYRVFVSCFDGNNGAAVHNVPFFVL